jgi:hypothetical protein
MDFSSTLKFMTCFSRHFCWQGIINYNEIETGKFPPSRMEILNEKLVNKFNFGGMESSEIKLKMGNLVVFKSHKVSS